MRPCSVALALLASTALSCGAPEEPPQVASPVVAPAPPPVVPRLAPRPQPIVLPPPVVDPEAERRAREEAERAAFEAEWPLHGVAYHFLGQVHARPDAASPVIGYVRRGSQVRAKAGLRGPGCARGWHEVVGGGYVCRGEGFMIGERPQTFEPSPVPAAMGDALPYAYAYVARDDAAQYWRLPTADEEAQATVLLEQMRAAASAAAAAVAEPVASADEEALGAPIAEPDLQPPPVFVDPVAEVGAADALAASVVEEPPIAASAEEDAGVPLALPTFLRMRMLRGFYVSVDREEEDGERRFFRTIRGTYVSADVLAEAQPTTMRGVVIGGDWQLPIGFVHRRGVRSLARDEETGALSQADPMDVHRALLLEEETIDRRGTRYRVARDGSIVRESALRIVPSIPRPDGIGEADRWIHVDLSEQSLVAYEGDRAVFATLVSTGREGFETPVGTYRIQSKHVSATMDDPDSPTEAYSIDDVPWTMYFEGSYALHGAFWHDSFGHVRSHGCVNLAPADARWLFEWTAPALPPGWHGIMPARAAGTFVHITD
jgi:hypothetical protein